MWDPTAVGVQVPCHDNDPGRGEEDVGVYPVQDLLEAVKVPIGREIHVSVVVGHNRHGEVRDEGAPTGVRALPGYGQVWGPVEYSGAPPGNSRGGLNGVVEGVHSLDDQGTSFLNVQGHWVLVFT